MTVKACRALALALSVGVWFLTNAEWTVAEVPAPSTQDVVAGNTAFALDLYAKLRTADGNLFFSPYSISTALAMTYAGARGDTATQMAKVLHFQLKQDQLHPAFAALDERLNTIQKKGNVQLNVANSLWPQKKYPFLPDYLSQLKRYYGTSVTPLDYVKSPEAARKTINGWVEQKTHRKITDLIKRGALNPLTRLVLANAVYFKGKWTDPFDPKGTSDQPFHLSTNKDVTCRLMLHEGDHAYNETADLQALALPYMGGDLSMIVLLPRKTDGLSALESELTPAKLTEWVGPLGRRKVDVFLPKFTFTREFSLGQTLVAMGMPYPFSALADFSGMDGRTNWLYISEVAHKAFVDVNEEGTEAAAATGVTVALAGAEPMPTVFRADHPFLFLIRDRYTGNILFIGRVVDPTQ
ncbi:MAG TPA: serpin family protein [Verrucomicrobiae bacterium]|nr:serpin family protein [Verrucomicrobiae bacterium]